LAGVAAVGVAVRGPAGRWLAARVRPAPRLFSMVTRLSLNGQTADPAALRQRPSFREVTWPALGPMPEAVVRNPARRLFLKGMRGTFSAAMNLLKPVDRCRGPEEVRAAAVRYFGERFVDTAPAPRAADLSTERLYEQVTVAGFYHVRPAAGGTHSLDLQFLREYPVRAGAYPCGGEAVIDMRSGTFLHLVTPEDRVVAPGDPTFALEALRFRSSLFQWLTIGPHSAWCHGVVGPKLFLATYALPEPHPLRELLRPFVFKVHENVSRAKVTVFGKAGVLSNTGSLTPESVGALIARGAYCAEVKTPKQMCMPPDLRANVEPLWDAVLGLAHGFLTAYSVGDDDPHVRAWRAFVAAHIHPEFRTRPLAEVIAYCLFTNSVAHHLWGHIHYGTTDPRYVSGMTRNVGAGGAADLMTVAEPLEISMLRLGVIISTRRQVVKLSGDLARSTDDPRARGLFEAFAGRVRTTEAAAPGSLQFDRIASSGMV
jgi:hypothetical protein